MVWLKSVFIASIFGALLTGCGSNDFAYDQEICDKLLEDANMFAEIAYEADLNGDTETYEYFKDAFFNYSQSYDENCSEFR